MHDGKNLFCGKLRYIALKFLVFFNQTASKTIRKKENLIGELWLSKQYSIVDPEKQNDDQLPFGGFVDRTRCTLGPT